MPIFNFVRRGAYHDSVTLMRLSREMEGVAGVPRAAVMMGTLGRQGEKGRALTQSWIDFDRTARQIYDRWRGFQPWPGAHTLLRGKKLIGGPQMLQLSLDGRRLYVTNSLFSSWDNQFYPQIGKQGSYLMQIDCDTATGGMKLNERFFIDFGKEPDGAVRAHEMRFPAGDATSDIWH